MNFQKNQCQTGPPVAFRAQKPAPPHRENIASALCFVKIADFRFFDFFDFLFFFEIRPGLFWFIREWLAKDGLEFIFPGIAIA